MAVGGLGQHSAHDNLHRLAGRERADPMGYLIGDPGRPLRPCRISVTNRRIVEGSTGPPMATEHLGRAAEDRGAGGPTPMG